MATLLRSSQALTRTQLSLLVAAGVSLLLALAAWAQVAGDRGIPPVAASRDIRISGVAVDTRGDSPQEAREAGYQEAARLAWERLKGPKLSDSQLSGMVSAIVVEHEQLGPRRYIARLGVVFDRSRASSYLGGEGQVARSAPLLLIPIMITAGSQTVFERRNPWQRAWAEYQTGTSRIDYVRPSGAGGDSLLVTFGQSGRRSRLWWRNILDQFGASDVVIAIARLEFAYPGGPITGRFTARYGPDSTWLAEFKLRATNPAQLPSMLEQAVNRFDAIYTQALDAGRLRPDPTLDLATPVLPPEVQALIEQGRAIAAREAASRPGEPVVGTPQPRPSQEPAPGFNPGTVIGVTIQFASPDAATVDATVGAVRGVAGVRGTTTSSLALGGTSILRVAYAGTADELAAALRARGFTVREGGGGLSISR